MELTPRLEQLKRIIDIAARIHVLSAVAPGVPLPITDEERRRVHQLATRPVDDMQAEDFETDVAFLEGLQARFEDYVQSGGAKRN